MQKAAELLDTTSHGIKQVAAVVGYGSVAAFSKAFKRWAGMPLGGYRHAAQGDGTVTSAPNT